MQGELSVAERKHEAELMMRCYFKNAVDGKYIGLFPDGKGRLRVPQFMLRASDIVNQTHSTKCYALLSDLLCSVESFRKNLVKFLRADSDYIEETFYFTKEESDEASCNMQELIRIHYNTKDCPSLISRFVEVLDECWPVNMATDEPFDEMLCVPQEVLNDLFHLVGEMKEVITVFGLSLEKVGAK